MDATFLRWGLTISTKKTKVLVVGRNAAAQAADSVITLCGDPLIPWRKSGRRELVL